MTPEEILDELKGFGDRTTNFGVYVGVTVKDYRLLRQAIEILSEFVEDGEQWRETFTLKEIEKHMTNDEFARLLVNLTMEDK